MSSCDRRGAGRHAGPFCRPGILGIGWSVTVSTGVDALDRSIHNSNVWLVDLEEQLGEDWQSA